MNDKISIIIPVYNTESYVERCIHSILAQTYRNIEVICVNDGSTDGCGRILDEVKVLDERIKVVHQKNQGVAAARNKALELVTGSYVGFVDSDDYVSNQMYQRMVETAQKTKADIVCCNYYMESDGIAVPQVNKKSVPGGPISTEDFLPYVYKRDEYKGVAGYLWSRLIARELLIDENGNLINRFETGYALGEDVLFMAHVFTRSHKTVYLDENLYIYVQRDQSAVHNIEKLSKDDSWVRAYEEVIRLYRQKNISDEILDVIIRMYVYRCGKYMEIALEQKDAVLFSKMREKVIQYYDVYIRTNSEYKERVEWIDNLLHADMK